MTDYRGFRITEIVAVVAIGDDDEEGVPAWMSPMGAIPLIAADPARLDQIKKLAQTISDQTGQNFEIIRFTARESIGEIKSSRKPQ
jgi:hypothetical protein